MKNLHLGHRQRMREKIDKVGFENLAPHEQLEYFLYIVVPRANTNELAHRLLKQFGTLSEIFNASIENLIKVDGVGQRVARFIKDIPAFSRAYFNIRIKDIKIIKTPADILLTFKPTMQIKEVEELTILCLDNLGRVLCYKNIAKGLIDQVEFNPQNIIKIVSEYMAKNIVIMHNHPFGDVTPSQEDIINTQKIYFALNSINVCLLDHYIFNTKGEVYSFLNANMFQIFDQNFSIGFIPIQPKMNQFKRIDKIKNSQ